MADNNDPSKVDVLIIGAGPSGLMAALWMSQLGIKTRVIDKHGLGVTSGHADGLHIRSVEVFDSFGFAHRLMQHAITTTHINSWAINEKGELQRSERTSMKATSGSHRSANTLHQGDIELLLLDAIQDRSDIKIERATLPTSLKFDKSQAEDQDAYPITVEVRHLEDHEIEPHHANAHSISKEGKKIPTNGRFGSILGRSGRNRSHNTRGQDGTTEVIHAKYMLGCDGAHSWTRRQLGFEMEGESKDMAWGVLDIIPITNFPDAHVFATVQSKSGAIIIIPRENNLIRVYIQMGEVKRDARMPFKVTPEDILAQAQKILSPYTFRYTYCDWWTVYSVGQRVGNHYSESDRIFLAGDAVHTHTPKGGQGMNISMQDSYNLGWKLGGVLNGLLPRSILKTYEAERRPIAQRLIAWDRELSRVYSGMSEELVHQTYMQNMQFLSGVGITYNPSVLVGRSLDLQENGLTTNGAAPNGTATNGTMTNGVSTAVFAKQHLAPTAVLGKRFPSHEVLRTGDWCTLQIQELLKSDGRWRLIVFGGDALKKEQMDRLNVLGDKLVTPEGLLKRYNSSRNGTYPIELLLIHSAEVRHDVEHVEMADFHSTFFPFVEDEGHEYYIIQADANGAAHGFFGIDNTKGCLVLLRPDQHVGYIGELDDLEEATHYLDRILLQHA